MRIVRSLVAVGAIAATLTAVAMVPASAEPLNPKTGKLIQPAAYDIVGVGSESITYLVGALTWDYNLTVKDHSPAHPYILSWDAVPPSNLNDTTQMIVVKAGCKKNLRPNGSSAGISDMTSYGNTSYTYKGKKHVVPCIDFARSSRPRKSTDPPNSKGGDTFVTLAGDAVTYATTANTNAPNNLNRNQLIEIFGCNVPGAHGFPANTWGALLGSGAKGASQKIDPIAPQAGSGTLSFWMETALGLPTDTEPTCGTAANLPVASQPEENEGTSPVFLLKDGKPNPNVIYPYSVGAFVAQEFHSAKCGKKPTATQNKFGCDERGVLNVREIAGVVPIVNKKTNPAWNFTPFHRFLYDVVRYSTSTSNHIPSYLNKWLGKTGYFCTQPAVMRDYGFEPTPHCGATG